MTKVSRSPTRAVPNSMYEPGRRAPRGADHVGESQPQEARISVRRQPWRDLACDIVAGTAGAEALRDVLSHRREVHRLPFELAPREARELDELPHELLHVATRRGEAIEPGAPFSVEPETVVHDERLAQIIHAP